MSVSQNFEESSTQRYDHSTAQRVLKLAADMQRHEQETYSAAQIETLAAELGIAPDLVRRALNVVASDPISPTTSTQVKRVVRRRIVRRNGLKAYVPQTWAGRWIPIQAAIVMGALYGNMTWRGWWVLFVLPFVLPALVGFAERDMRRALTAAFLTILLPLATAGCICVSRGLEFWRWYPYYAAYLLGGILLGMAGAELRRWTLKREPFEEEYEEVIEEAVPLPQNAR